MASPQLEDGYTRLANSVLEALARHPFTQRQYAVLLAVIRLSYGFNRKEAVVSSAKLAALTGCAPEKCRRTVRELEFMGVLEGEFVPEGKRLVLVKDGSKWGVLNLEEEGQNGPTYKDSSQKTVVGSDSSPPPPQTEEAALIFPPSLSEAEVAEAIKLLHGLNGTAQKILDVLEASIQAGTVKKSPLSLLRALANRARGGTFDPAPGLHIAARRDKAARERQQINAARKAANPPKDPAARARNAERWAQVLEATNQRRRNAP